MPLLVWFTGVKGRFGRMWTNEVGSEWMQCGR